MKIEKYVDLTECGAEYTLNSYLAAGWRIRHQGLTLIILEKEFQRMNIIQEFGHYAAYTAGGVFVCSGDTYNEVERELDEWETENSKGGQNAA